MTDLDQLIRQLRDPDRFKRWEAVLVLGQRKAHPAVPALIELLRDNATFWEVASSAAWALGEIGDRQAVVPLIGALDMPLVRGAAVEALAKLHDDRAVEPLIHLFTQTHEASLATVLGNWGDLRALEPLIAAMEHPNPHVRYYTARALGKLGDPRAVPRLEWAFHHDTEPINDTNSIRGKSVSYVAGKAIERIRKARTEAG